MKENEMLADFLEYTPEWRAANNNVFVFNESWDLLMEVWMKFRKACWNTFGYPAEFENFKERFMTTVFNGGKHGAYDVLVEAVKWYHTKK